jgi:hypothetical protein
MLPACYLLTDDGSYDNIEYNSVNTELTSTTAGIREGEEDYVRLGLTNGHPSLQVFEKTIFGGGQWK